jgi:hypothetical protein
MSGTMMAVSGKRLGSYYRFGTETRSNVLKNGIATHATIGGGGGGGGGGGSRAAVVSGCYTFCCTIDDATTSA